MWNFGKKKQDETMILLNRISDYIEKAYPNH
jgi:hypothetical protein